MKLVCFSDVHGYDFDLPDGDVLIFAGDFGGFGSEDEAIKFANKLRSFKHKYKIVVAGNHDRIFENEPENAKKIFSDIIYLQDSSVVIEGRTFYGSPWSREFNNWAFNLPEDKLKEKFSLIPKKVDVFITHAPPFSICDKDMYGNNLGEKPLLEVVKKIKFKYHIFGHIHQGYGKKVVGKKNLFKCFSCQRPLLYGKQTCSYRIVKTSDYLTDKNNFVLFFNTIILEVYNYERNNMFKSSKKSRQYLKRLAKERGLTISELLRDAIRKYLIDEEFNRVRKKVLTKLLRSGKVYTDEDIFKMVS
jgi:Icc-related predicted phosphoesterase